MKPLGEGAPQDIREIIFAAEKDYAVVAAISVERDGVVSGIEQAVEAAQELGLVALSNVQDGMRVSKGETVLTVFGDPIQIVKGEERLIGLMSKASGIATAAANAVELAKGRIEIVCGSYKKMPDLAKHLLQRAVVAGGAKQRIAPLPFVYLDKNYISILGGIEQTLKAASRLDGYTTVIQLRGNGMPIEQEALLALRNGADVLMIDTGNQEDIVRVMEALQAEHGRDRVKVAFAGNVNIRDIPRLADQGIDILCIGKEIVDAPLLDMKLDVISVRKSEQDQGLSLQLLEKSELRIQDVTLKDVNLNDIAQTAADTLGLERQDVLVVDVRNDHIALDILKKTVDCEAIIGKEKELLERIAKIPGITMGREACIHTDGILGLIGVDADDAENVLEQTREMGERLTQAMGRRAIVFPTGFELEAGMIEDTNSPYIASKLNEAGYQTAIGAPIPDTQEAVFGTISRAVDEGYGLIITTGGVGAEDKDHTVEGILQLDPAAAVPWVVKFRQGTGRHVKMGVRIAVAELAGTWIVALPGPNDEVRLAVEAMLPELQQRTSVHRLAEKIVRALRQKLRTANWHHDT